MKVTTVKDMINEGSFKDIDDKLNYEQRRAIDLTHQVLNSTSNIYQEDKNVSDLFEIYNEVLKRKTNHQFKISINRSQDCFDNRELIKLGFSKLIKNEPSSFLIVPISSDVHMMSSVVRRFGDDLSITIVNKGDREGYRKQYEEYIIDTKNVPMLIDFLTGTTEEYETEEVYKTIENTSKKKARLNVISNPQKTGNCFIKEPETAIKYAFATMKFGGTDFKRLRNSKGEAPFKPKWDITTESNHKRFVQTLIKQSRVIKQNKKAVSVLLNEFNKYQANKRYRKDCKNGRDNEYSFFEAFDTKNTFRKLSKEEKIKKLLGAVSCDNLEQIPYGIYNLVDKTTDNGLKENFSNVVKYASSANRERYFKNEENISWLNEMLSKTEKDFPWATKQLRFEFHLDYMVSAISHMLDDRYIDTIENVDKANSLYSYNPRNYFIQGVAFSDMADNMDYDMQSDSEKRKINYEEAVKCFTSAINLKPDYVDAYVMRGLTYQELGHTDKANRDLKVANKMDPSSISQLKGKNNSQISKTFKTKTIKKMLLQINPDSLIFGGKKWLKKILHKFRNVDNKSKNKEPNRVIENFLENQLNSRMRNSRMRKSILRNNKKLGYSMNM